MRRPLSLALRLTLLFAIAASIVFPVFGWVISQSAERHFEAGDTNELNIIAKAVEQALATDRAGDTLTPLQQRFDDILVGHHHASLAIITGDAAAIYTSPGPDLTSFIALDSNARDSTQPRLWVHKGHSYRALTRPIKPMTTPANSTYRMAVAVPIDHHLQFLTTFRQTLWLMIATGIVTMSLMGWLAVRQGHAPLRRMVTQIGRISANKLETRLTPTAVPYELAGLATSVNEMLDRITAAIHRLRDFNADIAHELRTPVSNLMTQSQVALSRPRTADQYREILGSNLEEYERLAQMVNDMLFIARTDNTLAIKNLSKFQLLDEVEALFDYYSAWAEERHISLAVNGDAVFTGDRLMLKRALNNLLSNAIRYSADGGTVQISLNLKGGETVQILVENSGKEIPGEHLPKLFDRFYRADPSRQQGAGTGLGLAIVQSIIKAHGGRITVTSNHGITRFQINLPQGPVSTDH